MKTNKSKLLLLTLSILLSCNLYSFDSKAIGSGIYNHFSNNRWKYATLSLILCIIKNRLDSEEKLIKQKSQSDAELRTIGRDLQLRTLELGDARRLNDQYTESSRKNYSGMVEFFEKEKNEIRATCKQDIINNCPVVTEVLQKKLELPTNEYRTIQTINGKPCVYLKNNWIKP